MQVSGLTEFIRSICISAIWAKSSWLFTSLIPWGVVDVVDGCLLCFLSSSQPLRSLPEEQLSQVTSGCWIAVIVLPVLKNLHLEGCNPWWLWHPCLLKRIRDIPFHSTMKVVFFLWRVTANFRNEAAGGERGLRSDKARIRLAIGNGLEVTLSMHSKSFGAKGEDASRPSKSWRSS